MPVKLQNSLSKPQAIQLSVGAGVLVGAGDEVGWVVDDGLGVLVACGGWDGATVGTGVIVGVGVEIN